METGKKPIRCKRKGCNSRFKTQEALAQHKADKHGFSSTEGQISASDFTDLYDDLPDGAFFAMADEMGLSHEDFC